MRLNGLLNLVARPGERVELSTEAHEGRKRETEHETEDSMLPRLGCQVIPKFAEGSLGRHRSVIMNTLDRGTLVIAPGGCGRTWSTSTCPRLRVLICADGVTQDR